LFAEGTYTYSKPTVHHYAFYKNMQDEVNGCYYVFGVISHPRIINCPKMWTFPCLTIRFAYVEIMFIV